MSVKNAIEQINTWVKELEELTGVTEVEQVSVNPGYDPSKPVGPDNKAYVDNPDYDASQPIGLDEETGSPTNFPYQTEKVEVNGAFSCERLQEIIDEYVQQITDSIASHAESIANIMSDWAILLALPSDPLKILTWAAKVVGGPIARQIAMIVELILDIVQLVLAIVNLITAVVNAISELISCLESAIFNAFNTIVNTIYQTAADLIATAEALVDDIIANALDASGAQDLLDEIDAISDELGTATDAIETAVNAASAAGESVSQLGTKADQLKTSIALDSLSLENRIEQGLANIDGTPILPGSGG